MISEVMITRTLELVRKQENHIAHTGFLFTHDIGDFGAVSL